MDYNKLESLLQSYNSDFLKLYNDTSRDIETRTLIRKDIKKYRFKIYSIIIQYFEHHQNKDNDIWDIKTILDTLCCQFEKKNTLVDINDFIRVIRTLDDNI